MHLNKQITLLGTNYSWGGLHEYQENLPLYKQNNMNFIRFWQQFCSNQYNLESANGYQKYYNEYGQDYGMVVYKGLGDYNLVGAQYTDELFELAEDNDVYMQYCLFNIWDFEAGHFEHNPYSTANGGFVNFGNGQMNNYWTHPSAIKYQKQLLRYIYARFGYSRSFAIMEYWNEADNQVEAYPQNAELSKIARDDWHLIIDSYFKSMDIYERATTTSYAWKDHYDMGNPSNPIDPWASQKFLDFANVHWYTPADNPAYGQPAFADPVDIWIDQFNYTRSRFGSDSPLFIGEAGVSGIEWMSYENQPYLKQYFLESIWAPLFFCDAAATSLMWSVGYGSHFYGDEQIRNYYKVAGDFIKPFEEFLPNMNFVYNGVTDEMRTGYFKATNKLLICSRDENPDNSGGSPYKAATHRTVAGKSMTFNNMDNGVYALEFYDVQTGATLLKTTTTASNSTLNIAYPAFSRYIAVSATKIA